MQPHVTFSTSVADKRKHIMHHDSSSRPIAALHSAMQPTSDPISLAGIPTLSSPAANHHGLVGHLLGLLHVGHQLVSILHVAQVVDASQVGVLGAKLVQGRVLQAGGGQGLSQRGNSSGLHGAGSHWASFNKTAYTMQPGSRWQQTAAQQGCMLGL